MTILCDASPVIFLGKINQLTLISQIFSGDIIIPLIIKSEIITPLLPPAEERVLNQFITRCQIVVVHEAKFASQSLSYADNCLLTYAINNKVDILLSDDKLVRRVAYIENIKPAGTLGILLRAMKKSIIKPEGVRELIHELIHKHRFRISINVFEKVLRLIENFKQ